METDNNAKSTNAEQPAIQPKTPQERDNLDLLETVCQLHSRALMYQTKPLHDAYIEHRKELETRLLASPKQDDRRYWDGFDFALDLMEEMYGTNNFRHGYNIVDCVKAKANRLPKDKIRKQPENNS